MCSVHFIQIHINTPSHLGYAVTKLLAHLTRHLGADVVCLGRHVPTKSILGRFLKVRLRPSPYRDLLYRSWDWIHLSFYNECKVREPDTPYMITIYHEYNFSR